MKITAELFQELCRVARLHMTLEESIEPEKYLESVTEAFSKIQQVDTEGVTPSFHPFPEKNVTREDVPEEPLSQEEALSHTTKKKDGYFIGPRAV